MAWKNIEYQRAYRRNNKHKISEHELTRRQRSQQDPEKWLKMCLSRVPKANRDVSLGYLVELWHQQGGRCALTGLKLEHQLHSLYSASIDRIDPSDGYNRHNVQLLCSWMQYAKRHHGQENMKKIIQEIRDELLVDELLVEET